MEPISTQIDPVDAQQLYSLLISFQQKYDEIKTYLNAPIVFLGQEKHIDFDRLLSVIEILKSKHSLDQTDVQPLELMIQSLKTKYQLDPTDINQLQSIIKLLEKKYRRPFEITLNSPNLKLCISPLNQRNKYRVYDMNSEYAYLNGDYNSIEDIQERIKLHTLSKITDSYTKIWYESPNPYNFPSKWIYIWKCPKCSHMGDEKVDKGVISANIILSNYLSNCTCQKCYHSHPYIKNVSIDVPSGEIYTSSGGSVSIADQIGKISIVLD